jgi:hypothetical protein
MQLSGKRSVSDQHHANRAAGRRQQARRFYKVFAALLLDEPAHEVDVGSPYARRKKLHSDTNDAPQASPDKTLRQRYRARVAGPAHPPSQDSRYAKTPTATTATAAKKIVPPRQSAHYALPRAPARPRGGQRGRHQDHDGQRNEVAEGEDIGSALGFTYKPPFRFAGAIEDIAIDFKGRESGGTRPKPASGPVNAASHRDECLIWLVWRAASLLRPCPPRPTANSPIR